MRFQVRSSPLGQIQPGKKRLSFRGKQNWLFFAVLSMLLPIGKPVVAGEINACKYLVVTDFTSDPYGIAKELRTQAAAKGFVVVSTASEVPQPDLFKLCVMSGSWSSNGFGGNVAMRVVDAVSVEI